MSTPDPVKTAGQVALDGVKDLNEKLEGMGGFDPKPTPPPPLTPAAEFGKRFGPTFKELNPDAIDSRPTLFTTPDIPAKRINPDGTKQTFLRCDPYNVGVEDGDLADYWSDSGQVIYIPDVGDRVTYPKKYGSPELTTLPNPGIDRVATFAHYNGVFATSPRLDFASYISRPEHYRVHQPEYLAADLPVGMVRNSGSLCNEALVISANGCLMAAGTQTSREGSAWPLPFLRLPENKKPTGGIAITTSNELCLITVTDTVTKKGQLAVVALEGKWLTYHTWPYMGLANQGSWSAFKLLGYVDLSIAAPDNVAAASNAYWESPGQTNGKTLAQIPLTDPNTRSGILAGEYGWTRCVATKGYAIVSSKIEDRAVVVDLTPLFAYFRQSWLANYDATAAARGPAQEQFPQSFDLLPTNLPKEIFSIAAAKPTCVLAGMRLERWTGDFHKAYVATEAGLILIVDTSSLMARYDFEQKRGLSVVGSFWVGKNPVGMCFSRFADGGLPLIPAGKPVDTFNNLFWVVCRGDRCVQQVITFGGVGKVTRTVTDARMDDPVGLGFATRGPILNVADYSGRKVHSFRVGGLQAHSGVWYGCGADGKQYAEYCGSMPLNGSPFAVNSVNVN